MVVIETENVRSSVFTETLSNNTLVSKTLWLSPTFFCTSWFILANSHYYRNMTLTERIIVQCVINKMMVLQWSVAMAVMNGVTGMFIIRCLNTIHSHRYSPSQNINDPHCHLITFRCLELNLNPPFPKSMLCSVPRRVQSIAILLCGGEGRHCTLKPSWVTLSLGRFCTKWFLLYTYAILIRWVATCALFMQRYGSTCQDSAVILWF